ncbi:hypothetical protein ACOQ27_002499 [Escherichia coli]|nr:hypothetical protein [Escherichia coli]
MVRASKMPSSYLYDQ